MRILLAILLAAMAVQAQEVRRALPATTGGSFDEIAKFLAGYPVTPGSVLSRLQESGEGKSHSAAFERLWARYNEHYFSPMRDWAAAELAPRISAGGPVFYFFSGPDALSPLALFPHASDYVLGGLEPVGGMAAPESLASNRLKASLDNLRNSTDVILSFSHFITKEMKADLEATEFRGVLPVILAFVAMTGSEVLDVQFFKVDGSGLARDSFGQAEPGGLPGVRVTFRRDPASAPQRIHYVQANVANDDAKSRDAFLRWAQRFGKGNAYLKAASYLMHEPYFSGVRNFLLGNAHSVLQDDSGIPFSFFQNGDWRCWFFGNYTGTLDIFRKYYQPALDAAFKSGGVPLPFGIGYKWRPGESNLLLAVRQAPPKAEPVFPPAQPAQPARAEPAVITVPAY